MTHSNDDLLEAAGFRKMWERVLPNGRLKQIVHTGNDWYVTWYDQNDCEIGGAGPMTILEAIEAEMP